MSRRIKLVTYAVGAVLAGSMVTISLSSRDAGPASVAPPRDAQGETPAAVPGHELPDEDVADIRVRVAEAVGAEPIMRIIVTAADSVFVETGVQKGGLCGWGHFIVLRKGSDGWYVEKIVEWAS